MKRLLLSAIAITIMATSVPMSHAQGGRGYETREYTAPRNDFPPPPPDSFVPESRPLENSAPSRERGTEFLPNPENRPPRDFRDFEPQRLDFVSPSRPSGSGPPLNDRPLFTTPDPGRGPNDTIPEFEPRPRDLIPHSSYPLGHASQGRCPSGRDALPCPNDQAFDAPRLCPFGRGLIEECPWESREWHGQGFEEYAPEEPFSYSGQPHQENENRGIGYYDSLPPTPIRQPAPYFRDEWTNPSAFTRPSR